MKIEKLKILDIKRISQDANGNPLRTSTGRDYTRVLIQTSEYGDKALSGFEDKYNKKWQKGDVVNLKVEQKGQYLNFSGVGDLEMRVIELEEKVAFLFEGKALVKKPALAVSNGNGDVSLEAEYMEGINKENMPF